MNLDFSQWDEEVGIAEVQDDYKLTNINEVPVDLTLYYPIASSLYDGVILI